MGNPDQSNPDQSNCFVRYLEFTVHKFYNEISIVEHFLRVLIFYRGYIFNSYLSQDRSENHSWFSNIFIIFFKRILRPSFPFYIS